MAMDCSGRGLRNWLVGTNVNLVAPSHPLSLLAY